MSRWTRWAASRCGAGECVELELGLDERGVLAVDGLDQGRVPHEIRHS